MSRLKALVLCDTKAVADTPEGAETRRKMAEQVLTSGTGGVADAPCCPSSWPRNEDRHPDLIEAVRNDRGGNPAGSRLLSAAWRRS